MADEPTAWEDINPMTVSARPQGLPSKSSDLEDRTTFRNELTACLTLTAPVGMTEEQRRDWFAVAWDTLKHIPADILVIGARAARQKCDHPSKIVPTIVAETKQMISWRRDAGRDDVPRLPGPEPEYCSPEEAAAILESVGLKSHFAPAGRNAKRHDNADWHGPKDEHAIGEAEAPTT